MAKRGLAPAAAGLFDAVPMTPAPVASGSLLSPEQVQRVRSAAASLRRDIARFQQQLARPLASWDEKEHQMIEANVALSFTLNSLREFLPVDLQSLVLEFVDLRARIVLREFEES